MNNNRGFTLLEVLVAIVLASLLMVSIYGVFSTGSAAKEQVEKQASALHLARVLSTRLGRELLGLSLDIPLGKSILSGGNNSQREPWIKFLTSSSGGDLSGMRWLSYRLGPDQDQRLTLWRADKGLNDTNEATEERLAQRIGKLTFSFYDGTNWRNEWNSSNDGRPVLVKIAIELSDMPDRPPLESVFTLSQPGSKE